MNFLYVVVFLLFLAENVHGQRAIASLASKLKQQLGGRSEKTRKEKQTMEQGERMDSC